MLAGIFTLTAEAAAPIGDPEIVAMSLVDHIIGQRFNAAARLFHYPKTQSADERKVDQNNVAFWLQRLSTQLGHLKRVDALGPLQDTSLVTLSIAGGDVAYWSTRGAFRTVRYRFRASFGREPDTQVTIQTMQTDELLWEIQSFTFGVAASRPDARTFIAALARRLAP